MVESGIVFEMVSSESCTSSFLTPPPFGFTQFKFVVDIHMKSDQILTGASELAKVKKKIP